MDGIAFVLGPPNKAVTIELLQRRSHVSEREAEEAGRAGARRLEHLPPLSQDPPPGAGDGHSRH